MKKMSETIVFFGSGPVAARSLEYLSKILKSKLSLQSLSQPIIRRFPRAKNCKPAGLKNIYGHRQTNSRLGFSDKPSGAS